MWEEGRPTMALSSSLVNFPECRFLEIILKRNTLNKSLLFRGGLCRLSLSWLSFLSLLLWLSRFGRLLFLGATPCYQDGRGEQQAYKQSNQFLHSPFTSFSLNFRERIFSEINAQDKKVPRILKNYAQGILIILIPPFYKSFHYPSHKACRFSP